MLLWGISVSGITAFMAPVPAMHEPVEKGAGQKQEEWQDSKKMSPVLGEEEKGGDQEKSEKNNSGPAAMAFICRWSGHRPLHQCPWGSVAFEGDPLGT